MKKGVIVGIVIVGLVIIIVGAYFLLFQNHDSYSCGSNDLTSKLPKNIGGLEMNKISAPDTCSNYEIKLRGTVPKMTKYAFTSYKSSEGGTYNVGIIQFANEADTKDVENNMVQDVLHNRQPILQSFGMNKVVWAMLPTSQGVIVTGASWKSGNNIIAIDNQGNKNVNSDLVVDLLANYPSDNDIVLNSTQ